MKKYAKVINEYKQCDVGLGDDVEFYKSIGMEEMEVEQGYDGVWYVKGHAPVKPQSEVNAERIAELKRLLADSDWAIVKIAEGSATHEQYADLIEQRKAWRAEINELGA